MKNVCLFLLFIVTGSSYSQAQNTVPENKKKDIYSLINKYSEAREKRDTVLLKNILTEDIDQLVSSGEWRDGINASVQGMLQSSASTPGQRTLNIEKIRLLNPTTALVDCRYEIQNGDSTRKMWSSFVAVSQRGQWKISAIRNMLPSQ
jgi:uncharacterized protein (TIGR02246 family)